MDYELDILLNGVRHVVIGDDISYSTEGRWTNVQMMRGGDLVLAVAGTDLEFTARPYDEERRQIEAMARGGAPLIVGGIPMPRPEPDFAEVFGVGERVRYRIAGEFSVGTYEIFEIVGDVAKLHVDWAGPGGDRRYLTYALIDLKHAEDDEVEIPMPRVGSAEHAEAQDAKNAIFKAALEKTSYIPSPIGARVGDWVRSRVGGPAVQIIAIEGNQLTCAQPDYRSDPETFALSEVVPVGAIDADGNPVTPPPAMNKRTDDDG